MSVIGWLDRLVDEQHRSERIAARWHLALAAAGVLSVLWHLFGAHRHFRAARQFHERRRP